MNATLATSATLSVPRAAARLGCTLWEFVRLATANPHLSELISRPDGRVRCIRLEDLPRFAEALNRGKGQ